MSGSLLIGVGRRRLTPEIPCQMAGFDARKSLARDVHDDLHARALVVDDGREQIALVSVEVIAVSAVFSAKVRSAVEKATRIPAKNVLLSATHTHCGPVTLNHFFNQGQPLDDAYINLMADQIVAAVEEAFASRKSRRLRSGLIACDGIAVNRRTKDGLPVDPYAGVLLVEEEDGRPAAIAVIYACHTTVLGPDTLSITQDFPYYTIARLQQKLGGDVEAVYFNGAQGDLSIGHKSDLSAVGVIDSFRTFATAQRLGERLADAALSGLGELEEVDPAIAVESVSMRLPLKSYRPLVEMTEAKRIALAALDDADGQEGLAGLRRKQTALFARIEEYYASLYEASQEAEPKVLPLEFTAIGIGNTVLLSLPGEVFVQIALDIRSASPFAKTMFLGLTNDYAGYIPTANASATSGYEVVASRVPGEASRQLTEEAVALLRVTREKSLAAEGARR
ncbi:MAG TPA: neutral/alkaline non-lysosomal ceramidase N-terminal domain-containing protein [Edaphobacter sp.]